MPTSQTIGVRLLRSALGDRTEAAMQNLTLSYELTHTIRRDVDARLLAAAMNVALFDDLLQRVPSGAAYVAERRAAGERVVFDHGALRTIRFAQGPTGGLPAGEDAFTRLFEPLGYTLSGTYPLPKLKMTGRSYAFAADPEKLPQFFLSELHVEQFSDAFGGAAHRVFDTSTDPVSAQTLQHLEVLQADGHLPLDAACHVLADLLAAFGCQHAPASVDDYETLLAESAEAAWIATEGNAFNHATDRVDDVQALAGQERAAGRPIKDRVEVSASGRVLQTAHRAVTVSRPLRLGDELVQHDVPGSFYEFISRHVDPATGRLDLRFDSSNATGIFAMTEAARAS